MKRDNQLRSVRGTDIARQTLVPGETPMRALSSGQHLFSGCKGFGWRGLGGAFQADGLAANNRCRQVRRMPQRGQSSHSTGIRGGGWGTASGAGEMEEGSIGNNTALTRRGLSVVLLS